MNLHDFLNPVSKDETREVVVTDRFIQHDAEGKPILDEAGNTIPAKFKIKALTEEEVANLRKKCTRKEKNRSGQWVENFDSSRFVRALVVAATVEPDFAASELCAAYGVMDPLDVPGKMLLAGEYTRLSDEICTLSRIFDDEVEEDAKN